MTTGTDELSLNRIALGRVQEVKGDGDGVGESELIARSQRGEGAAFRILVERYQRKVFAVARGMVGNEEAAMDVAQDAFIKAYCSIRGFREGATFYTWLYRIVINCCIDHLRREKRANVAGFATDVGPDGEDRVLAAVGTLQAPDASVRNGEIRRALLAALDELPEEQKAVLLLREVEGLSYKDIASAMKCSKGTVMSRLHYARRKLQEKLRGIR